MAAAILPNLSVLLPAHNEAANLKKSVSLLSNLLSSLVEAYEIIIVNDGSTDQTGEIAEALAKNHAFIRAFHHPKNLGYGPAIQTAIAATQYERIFWTDSDLQFDYQELPAFLWKSREYEVVHGYRSSRQDSQSRIWLAGMGNWFVQKILGLPVRDVGCAFKIFPGSFLRKACLVSGRGGFINTEVLILAQKQSLSVLELPVSHYPRLEGKSSGGQGSVLYANLLEFLSASFRCHNPLKSHYSESMGTNQTS